MECNHSPWFWMRSAGFSWNLLEAFKALDTPEVLQNELLNPLQFLRSLEAELVGCVQQHNPQTLVKVQRRFAEKQTLQVHELPLNLRELMADGLQKRQDLMAALAPVDQVLQAQFVAKQHSNRVQLVRCFQDEKLREAVFMSNPEALKRMDDLLEGLASQAEGAVVLDSRTRQRLRLAWNYLQRFCAKNDTASFFGPIAWGRWQANCSTTIKLEVGQQTLAKRQTFLEHWVVHGIGQAMAQDSELWPELPLMLSPSCMVRGNTLHYPVGKTIALQGWSLRWVETLSANRDQSLPLTLNGALAQSSWQAEADAVCQHLQVLVGKGVVLRGMFLPPGAANPLQQFRDALNAMSTGKRYEWLEWLDDLERHVQRYAHGDLALRMESLAGLCAALQAMGVNTERQAGGMYVGRFPVYEDCLRGVHVELGQDLSHSLSQSLDPVLHLYSWLMGAIVLRVQEAWVQHANLSTNEPIDFLAFYEKTRAVDLQSKVVEPLREVLRSAWGSVLPLGCDGGQSNAVEEYSLNEHDFAKLMQLLQQASPHALAAAKGLWCVHSPDVMLAAGSVEAIQRGEYQWILGELHPGVHTVSQPVALPFCPWPGEVLAEVEALLKPGTVVAADSDAHYQRSHIDWPPVPSLHQVVLPGATPKVLPNKVWHAGQLQVVWQDGQLLLCHELGQRQALLTAMPSEVHRCAFELAADAVGYAWPVRLVYKQLVVKRRSWSMPATALPAPGLLPSENWGAYLAWRQWQAQQGMPMQVFVKVQNEPKPILLDYDNPLSLDLLVNLSKQAASLRFSEMRPTPSELWLADPNGRYCSEFRTSFMPCALVD